MPLQADISTALQLLEHIQHTIDVSDDAKLQAQTKDDLDLLISVLENPILRSIVTIQDSLGELNQQLIQHPSILPVDFDITPCGKLLLNVPPPVSLYDVSFDPDYANSQEFDDQRVPVAKLPHSSSGESSSPQIASPSLAPEDVALPPITTPTYAIEFQKAIQESSQGREVLTVQLYKPEGSSLGFSVVGLRSEEKGELGIFVQEIQPTGIAGRDGRIHEGDQILAIDGQPLDSNISHQQAISILQKARGLVELVVARNAADEDVAPPSPSPSPVDRSPSAISDTSKAGSDMVLNTEWAQVEIIDLINDGSGLGFGIIGGRSTGVVVKTILPGGVADRDNRLQSGDHILQIGDVNLRGMGSEQVAAVLRQSGSHVRLVVARPVEPTSPDYQALGSHAPIVPTKILGDPEELDRHLVQNGYPETFNTQTPILDSYDNPFMYQQGSELELHPEPNLVVDVVRNPVPIGSAPIPPRMVGPTSLPVLTMDMMPLETPLPEMEKFSVELKKDYHGLGITIAGYVCEKEELSGIFVKSISEGSAADLCKKIQVNDRIVEVDGKSLQGYNNHQAVEMLRNTGQTVRLCLERYLRGPKFEQLQQAIANSELKPPTPSSPSATSLPQYPVSTDGEEPEIEVEAESHTTVDSCVLEPIEALNTAVDIEDVELLIDSNYIGELKPTVEAAIQAKWSKIMGPDVEIVVAQLCKFNEGGGLGISLEGTVDVEDGQEVRPHHYIRSILPEGPVGANGRLRSGDELLEVNGHRLLGMNHIEVVTILKDLPMNVRMVCARRPGETTPYRLIDTSQDRAAFAARNILGGSLQNLIPATDRLVKAKSDGSLASTTTTATATDASFSKMKSRSLEPLTGLAMWSSEPQIIELVKGDRGLGFSILDYQDPMNPNETVIVIRSLVPGGVAQLDGRLIPGDRLLFVNDTGLENASLDRAVQALKGAPKGVVRIGVAKPLPIPDSASHSQELEGLSQATPTLDDNSMFSSSGSLSPAASDLEHEEEAPAAAPTPATGVAAAGESVPPPLPQSPPPATEEELARSTDDELSGDLLQLMVPVATERLITSQSASGDLTDEELDDEEAVAGWGSDVLQLPSSLELDIRIHKGADSLGLSIDSVDKGVNGMLVVSVAPGGAMAKDGRIVPGDYLLSVNNESLRKVTNSQARAILRRAQLLNTDISVTYIPGEAATAYRKSLLQTEVSTVPIKHITQISPSSPYIQKAADALEVQSGLLKPQQTKKAESPVSTTVTRIVSESEYSSCVELSPLLERCEQSATDFCNKAVDPTIPISASADSVCSLNRQKRDSCEQESLPNSATISPSVSMTVTTQVPSASAVERGASSPSVLLAKHWGPERSVEVLREPNCSLGISIVGGKVDLYNAGPDSGSAISGIFIKNVLPQSPAGRTGELKTGDRILEVDGIDLRHASHERAVEVIRSAGNPVCFLVQSLIQWSVDGEVESHSTEVAPTSSSAGAVGGSTRRRAPAPPSPTGQLLKSAPPQVPQARTPTPEVIQVGLSDEGKQELQQSNREVTENKRSERKYSSSEDSEEDEEDVRDLEGRIFTKKGQEIHRASAGNVKRSKEEIEADPEEEDEFGYTTNKVKKKYGEGAVVATLERGPAGLGLSLAGHKDRNKMAVLVCGLNPAGAAHKSGCLRVGDEILEVNGVVLQGRCHLNASAIIKGLPGPVFKVIVLRREKAIEDLAVKPITQFPVSLDDETPEEKYSNFKGLRTVTIKKGSQGLGIMIIEGKHAEVGQGIFISDIQEGSAAEQAGLVVGDMILAVNKDTLLGSDYDSAASLLKKTEGVVTLIVCNPNKAKQEEEKKNATGTPSPGESMPVQQASSPTPKEPEKPRLFPKPLIPLAKPQKTPSPKSVRVVSPTSTPTLVDSLSPGTCVPKQSPVRPTELVTTTDTSPSARLSPSPSGKRLSSTPEEPPADPATCEIVPGKETTVEINKDKMGLGLSIVGGSDTLLGVIIIHEVYPDGAAAKDGRLKPGDQILEVNSEDFRNITHSKALAALRQTPAKVKMVVFRDEASTKEDDIFDVMEVELTKKPGKGLGLSIVGRKNGHGVFISDVVHGGTAEADGRLMKGDQILAVNGQDLKNSSQEEAAAVLKTATGKVAMRIGRLKAGSRGSSNPGSGDRLCSVAQGQKLVHADTWPNSHQPTMVANCTQQNFHRFSSTRASLVHHFSNWSFRKKNI
ncbi:multiple PDZ domain protein isoform X5 [Schistocerca gregaria]|uniref:multiple PDZ domain protein isoform X5 n=1 Tax=Schistocerca gregaria TaxID=7010 RepID=UPI00211E7A4D|nr:multiple PDZ domain protein isoform X5 [Schistocerca gregaria]